MKRPENRPDWNALGEITFFQNGWFTNEQAATAGFSPQVLHHAVKVGRVERVRRGIYRMGYSPELPDERYVEVALWAGRDAVISHASALVLLRLVDPPRGPSPPIQLTVPYHWRGRRFRHPPNVELRYGHVPPDERIRRGWGDVTNVFRTLRDCADDWMDVETLREAARRGVARRGVTQEDVDILLGWCLRG